MKEFLQFHDYESCKNSCIPWKYIWNLHDAKNIWIDCILQVISILNLVQKVYPNYFYDLNEDHVFLTTILQDSPKHVYMCIDGHVANYTIRYNYTVRFHWKQILKSCCFFSHRFYQRSIFMNIMSLWDIKDDRLAIFYNKLNISNTPIPLWEESLTKLLWNMISTKFLRNYKTTQYNHKKLMNLFSLIQKEIQVFTNQFKNQENAYIILSQWIDIIRSHQDEFWQYQEDEKNLEFFTNRMKTYLYQILVEHNYQHVKLKGIHFKKLIISMFLWACEYAEWLHTQKDKDKDRTDDIFVMVSELFLVPDELYKEQNIIVFKDNSSPFLIQASELLCDTHPILRTSILFK